MSTVTNEVPEIDMAPYRRQWRRGRLRVLRWHLFVGTVAVLVGIITAAVPMGIAAQLPWGPWVVAAAFGACAAGAVRIPIEMLMGRWLPLHARPKARTRAWAAAGLPFMRKLDGKFNRQLAQSERKNVDRIKLVQHDLRLQIDLTERYELDWLTDFDLMLLTVASQGGTRDEQVARCPLTAGVDEIERALDIAAYALGTTDESTIYQHLHERDLIPKTLAV